MSETPDPIRQTLDAYRAAVLARDVDAFVALYAPELEVFDTWQAATLRGLPAWRDMATAWFASLDHGERVVVDARDVVSAVSGDLASGHAVLTFTAMSPIGERLRWLSNRITLTMRRDATGWKVIHEHTSAPIDHVSGKAVLQFDD